MIVARSFSPPSTSYLSEKNDLTDRQTRSIFRDRSKSPQRTTSSPNRGQKPSTTAVRSNPVKIPSKNVRSIQSQNMERSAPVSVKSKSLNDRQEPLYKLRRGSARDVLSATAIPARRRPKGRACQRLPAGDHVADFSKFLLDDIPSNKEASLGRTHTLSQIDELFGNIDEIVEGQIIIGSEGVDESGLSARSISSDSLASLASPDDYSSSHLECRSNSGRSLSCRQTPRVSPYEDCSGDHPLADLDEIDSLSLGPSESVHSSGTSQQSSRTTSPPPRTLKKEQPMSSFKSTLTSSLKALKTAARTTLLSSSGFGPHGGAGSPNLYTNESLLAHNFFDIQPSLTDDRRPPPTITKPSPELRRYLNPQMASAPPDSPVQLHFWQDERYTFDAKREAQYVKEKVKQRHRRKRSPAPKSKIDSLPAIVPLSTCLPPTIRTANASSPPVWLAPDGQPMARNAANSFNFDPDAVAALGNGMPKNREPRENRDFLRMYVCEMAMRRNGKLSDDLATGRARLWLPPVPGFQATNSTTSPIPKAGAERWKSWSADEMADSDADDFEQ